MADIDQQPRFLSVQTGLGEDVLLLAGFSGSEAISQLFSFELDLFSEQDAIAPSDLVGTAVGWQVAGFNESALKGRDPRGMRGYRIEVVPWLWFLTRTADCRIFQQKSVPEIIKAVFALYGFSDFRLRLKGNYAPRDYCVQYRETAFHFVSRLMEDEGIFYFFEYEEKKHTLVIADEKSAFAEIPESPVPFHSGAPISNRVTGWEHGYEYRSGKWARTDYNFETPSTNLLTTTSSVVSLPNISKFEVFEFPGSYLQKGAGTPVTKIRMEEDEAAFDVVAGTSLCSTFTAGGKFTLELHEIDAENGGYVINGVTHSAIEASYSSGGGSSYTNSFTCFPDSVSFRPRRVTPKAFVQGLQTAVVVGPSGEEIYVDKYGRVKVQFFWDRLGKNDENSSCWVRVAEQWAGKNWGFVAHPRIGQEVIVEFLEGDPDRPLITGRVYNAEQMPPYDLPAQMTQSGMKSRSTKGGGAANFNEFRFEDKKGSEQIYLHAEKDQVIEVENDETHTVGHDRKKTIDNDETNHIKRDRTETVDRNESITVKGNRTETVEKDESITINGGRTEKVAKDETITISGSRTETVDKDESITVSGSQTISVSKDVSVTISGGRTSSVSKDESTTISGGQTISVGKALSITASDSITLTTGSASITMKSDGTITISGQNITIKGSGGITAQASGNMVLKGAQIAAN